VRILHSADWQIGKPYKFVGDPQKRFRLQDERLRALGRIDAAARSQGARAVVVAGDLFDSTTVAISTALEVLEAIGAMALPVLVIPGNHDHGAPGGIWDSPEWQRHRSERAPNLQLLLERQPLELEELVVLPCPLLRKHDASDPTGWIRGLDWASLPAGKPRLVIAHGGIQGFSGRDYGAVSGPSRAQEPDGAINRIDLAQLPLGELDYIALGDWHNLKQVGPKAWYSGTPEPDRHDQGEANQRGQVLRVDLGRGQEPQVQVLATGRLGWHNLAMQLATDADLEQLEARIQACTGGRVNQDLLRLELSGSLSLAAHRRYSALVADLEHQLLDLRLKGGCDQAPQAEELAALTERPADPLIARVALELQARLARQEGIDEAAAAISRAALCELFRLASSP
jgi:DNA repair exonuclease SbcCD nuclease subunit